MAQGRVLRGVFNRARVRNDLEAAEETTSAQQMTPSSIPKIEGSYMEVYAHAPKNAARTSNDWRPAGLGALFCQACKATKDAIAAKSPLRASDTLQAPSNLVNSTWHTMSPEMVAEEVKVSIDEGLSAEEAERRLLQDGPNIPTPPPTNRTRTILGYFFGGFGSILLAGSILVFVSWKPLGEPPALANLALAVVMLAVFFVQAGFNMYQDWSASKVMSSITDMLPLYCEVVRDGKRMSIEARGLVVGDKVLVKASSKVPADMRFVDCSPDALFDRSVVTGESEPVCGMVNVQEESYLESWNIGLQGTLCTRGAATGIVVATGDDTVFGHVASSTNQDNSKLTTLEKEVRDFVRLISIIMAVMITLVVVIWAAWLRTHHPKWINISTLIVDCVSVAVAFIPEGLPIAVTAGLTITAAMMKKNKMLCKSLKTVETLGAVSVLCSDKTATLTEGFMHVTELVIGERTMTVVEARQEFAATGPENSAVSPLLAIASLCNIRGNITDSALFRFCENIQPQRLDFMRACWKKVHDVAFSSKYKFMVRCFMDSGQHADMDLTLPKDHAEAFDKKTDILLTIKGAPEILLPRCTHYISASGPVLPLDPSIVEAFEASKNNFSSQSRRCLVLAYKIVPQTRLNVEDGAIQSQEDVVREAEIGLVLVGLVALTDPLRPGIKSVVSSMRGAGIKVAMVTGDFALTAVAVAREAGIVTSRLVHGIRDLPGMPQEKPPGHRDDARSSNGPTPALVISGHELEKLEDHQWEQVTHYDEVVFSRTTPEQKLRIVHAFQKDNKVVAMIGDGVNDAPSLKAADVGICMCRGSNLAKEAADMILLKEFDAILHAIKYGRVVFDNLKKVIAYLLPAGSFSEFWPVMASVVFGLPQILSSFLMIVICCLTDCMAATTLSYEAAEADVLLRQPRDLKRDRLVNTKLMLHAYGLIGMVETLASFVTAFWYLEQKGIPFSQLFLSFGKVPNGIDKAYYDEQLNTACSIYFVNLVVMQLFNLMATRTRRLSIFQHPPIFNKATQNVRLFPAMIFAVVMAAVFVYVPPLQKIIQTSNVPVEFWFFPVISGVMIILIDEARRFYARNYPKGIVARLAW